MAISQRQARSPSFTSAKALFFPDGLSRPQPRPRPFGKVSDEGDKTALQAILTAPAYLIGVDEEMLSLIRDDAAKGKNPERHADAAHLLFETTPANAELHHAGGVRF